LDLLAAGADFHVIPKVQSISLQRRDPSWKICHLEDDAIPSAGLLASAIGHRTRAGCTRTAENQFEIADQGLREMWAGSADRP
jgi:hypothetical protein